jgi:SAM-dependent methyltransferase
MSIDTTTDPQAAFVERVFSSLAGAFDVFALYIGHKLGYYVALDGGALTPAQLAQRTGTHERYAREWLEQQATTGVLACENQAAAAGERRYVLPEGRRGVLVDRESLDFVAPIAQLFAGAVSPLPRVLDAYRTGGGVLYADYGADLLQGQGDINRAAFLQQLGPEWLAAIPDVHARLQQASPPARVADIGCGVGWSTIGIAQAYPNARVEGFDLDEASIAAANENIAAAAVGDRASAEWRNAADPALAGAYDLVIALESVHDMSDPAGALATMRRLLAEGGAAIVVDERVADTFMGDGNDVEWMMYGWSILHCLPAGMAGQPSAGTGTVMRLPQLREYARQAGFRDVERLAIENFLFSFYRLVV